MLANVFHAATRFGLGLKPGEEQLIGSDPESWLMGQLARPVIPPLVQERYGGDPGVSQRKIPHTILQHETAARFLAQLRSGQPFVERLVMFWSNHFTVSTQKIDVMTLANAYEADAIRPHVNGYFRDMLAAVIRHPAMLAYLDNDESLGPRSQLGLFRNKGSNENLAREILELHTLGVGGGYTQDDVIALSHILTGWGVKRTRNQPGATSYAFTSRAHEPGTKTLLGYSFTESGEEEGLRALATLAAHPSTARFVCTKLARHFIADDPPAEAVEAITNAFLQSDGHLPTVMQALIARQEAWQPLVKYKTPYELLLSAYRLTGKEPTAAQMLADFKSLSYIPFGAPSPAGFPDVADGWASQASAFRRVEWAHQLAQTLPPDLDAAELAETGFGAVLSDNTRQTVAGAASNADGIALALASPEFQRR